MSSDPKPASCPTKAAEEWHLLEPSPEEGVAVECHCLTGAVGPGVVEATSCWTCKTGHEPCGLCQQITLSPKHRNEAIGNMRLKS